MGCILLELTIGHDTFNELWMVAYDYNNLLAPDRFAHKIVRAVESVRSVVKDVDLLDLVTSLLRVVPTQRSSVARVYGANAIASHPWLRRADEDPNTPDPPPVEPANPWQSESGERASTTNLATLPRNRADSNSDVLGEAEGTMPRGSTKRSPSIPRVDTFSDGNGASPSPRSSKKALASPREKLFPLGPQGSNGRLSLTAQRPLAESPRHRSSPALSTYNDVGGSRGETGGRIGRKSPGLVVTDADEHARIPDGSTGFPPPSPMASSASKQGFDFASPSPRMKEPLENAASGGNPSLVEGGGEASFTPASPPKLSAGHKSSSAGFKRNMALAVDVGPRARHLTKTGKALPISNMSSKARADYGQDLHMPPLEPDTPNIHGARKNFRKLQETVNRGSSSDVGTPDNGASSAEPWSPGGDSKGSERSGDSGSTPKSAQGSPGPASRVARGSPVQSHATPKKNSRMI